MLSECASGVPRAIYRPDASILHEMGSRKGCTTLSNTISILEALWSRPVAARLTGLPARASIVAERARLPDACGSDRTGERTRPRATAESMAVATRVGTFARHPLTGFSCKLENAARFRFWTSPSMTNSALGLMRASSSLRMEIEASSSFKKEGHGRRVGAWARGGVAHGRRWHGSLRPSGGITYRTIRAASHNLNESVACK
jgi:hypothetical protein